MVSKLIGVSLLLACIVVSILRGTGYLDGDFIIPLLLLGQLLILGYLVQLTQIIAKDIIARYTRPNNNTSITTLHTWN